MPNRFDTYHNAIVRVGHGRGFVVQAKCDRLVITAAHCLPHLPRSHAASSNDDRIYPSLIGPLAEKPRVWAQCLFADPVADIAVLGPVDNQVLFAQSEAFEEFTEGITLFAIADAPLRGSAWLYSLDERWFRCPAECMADGPLWLFETERIKPGMSGSPTCDETGRAIGVVAVGRGGREAQDYVASGPNPAITRSLPAWLLRELEHPVMTCIHCGLDNFHHSSAECIQALRERASMLEEAAKAEAAW